VDLIWLANAGLIQLRNEMAHFIRNSSEKLTHGDSDRHDWPFGQLPQPINNVKVCEGCPQLLACAVYQRFVVFADFSTWNELCILLRLGWAAGRASGL